MSIGDAAWDIKPEYGAPNYLMQFSTNFVIMLAQELAIAKKLSADEFKEILKTYQDGLKAIANSYNVKIE